MIDQGIAGTEEAALVDRCLAVGIRPLWKNPVAHGGNRRRAEPMVWPWRAVAPLIDGATAVTSMDALERRVLSLVDPAYADNGSVTTRNLNAGFQILLPGERARPHRHSMNAIRFVVEGNGATTMVDGKACPMNFGDLILTPAWTWHDHVHSGSQRIVWLDVLDGQLHRYLETDVFEPGPIHDLTPLPSDAAFGFASMLPEGAYGGNSPVFHYPWTVAREALAAAPRGTDGMRRVRYINPATGGAVTSLLDCVLWQIEAGTATRNVSTSAHAVCTVVEGTGTSQIGERSIAWGPRDVFTVPAGEIARHVAHGETARLFVVSDREVLRRLDLLTERTHD
jgi:gentisate 1,2-dioxygenase